MKRLPKRWPIPQVQACRQPSLNHPGVLARSTIVSSNPPIYQHGGNTPITMSVVNASQPYMVVHETTPNGHSYIVLPMVEGELTAAETMTPATAPRRVRRRKRPIEKPSAPVLIAPSSYTTAAAPPFERIPNGPRCKKRRRITTHHGN